MILKAYCYWFYKIDSLLERYEQTRWLSRTKALIISGFFEICFAGSLYFYFKILNFQNTDKFNLGPILILLLACVIIAIRWRAFKDDHWKLYIKDFEKWDRKNSWGTWAVAFIAIAIVTNLSYAVTLLRHMKGWSA